MSRPDLCGMCSLSNLKIINPVESHEDLSVDFRWDTNTVTFSFIPFHKIAQATK